jgi:hypothetical protein
MFPLTNYETEKYQTNINYYQSLFVVMDHIQKIQSSISDLFELKNSLLNQLELINSDITKYQLLKDIVVYIQEDDQIVKENLHIALEKE